MSPRRWNAFHLALLGAWPLAAALAIGLHVPPTLALAVWLLANVLVLGLGERRQSHRRDWQPQADELRRDGTVWAMNLVVDAVVGAGLVALAIATAPGTSSLPLLPQVLLGLLVAELGSYWIHRWSHAGGWLWRVHLLHHRPERVNVANALTAHPINAAWDKAVRLLPLLLLGLSPEALLAIGLFGVTQALAVHANIDGTLAGLERWIGSAEAHRLHHSTRPADAGNFGTQLLLWDRVFGTWRAGRTPDAVGVFSPADYPGERELWRLLWWPCTAMKRCSAAPKRSGTPGA